MYKKVRPGAWHLTGASMMLVLFPLLVQEVEQMDIVKYMNRYMNYFQHKKIPIYHMTGQHDRP